MQNPFETGHIKNYMLLYASVVVIMILFFIAASLFHEVEQKERKEFSTEPSLEQKIQSDTVIQEQQEEEPQKQKFQVLQKGY